MSTACFSISTYKVFQIYPLPYHSNLITQISPWQKSVTFYSIFILFNFLSYFLCSGVLSSLNIQVWLGSRLMFTLHGHHVQEHFVLWISSRDRLLINFWFHDGRPAEFSMRRKSHPQRTNVDQLNPQHYVIYCKEKSVLCKFPDLLQRMWN